jgi:hypothetical protein
MGSPTRFVSALVYVLRETVGDAAVAALLRVRARGDARCDAAGCSVMEPVRGCEGAAFEGVDVDISTESSLMESLVVGVPVNFNCQRKRAGGCPCQGCKDNVFGQAKAAAAAGVCRHRSVGCWAGLRSVNGVSQIRAAGLA